MMPARVRGRHRSLARYARAIARPWPAVAVWVMCAFIASAPRAVAADHAMFGPPGRTALPDHLLLVDLDEGLLAANLGSTPSNPGEADAAGENPWAIRKWIPLLLLVGLTLGIGGGIDSPDEPRWDAHNSFDDSARDALRASSESGRDTSATLSTAFLATNAALLVGDWYLERDLYSPIDSLRVDTTWVFAGQLANFSTKLAAARARPFVDPCERGLVRSGCADDDRYMSFYSGHTSLSSTFAGLLCARRLHRPDRSGVDILACGGASSLALATGFLRVASDDHWMTDVLVGWGTGVVFGYIMPTLLHYRHPRSRLSRSPRASHFVSPIAGTEVWGLRYDVVF